MKRKIMLLVGVLFLVSGCSIEYNLEVDENNNYKENFTITAEVNSVYGMDELYNSYLEEYPIYSDEYEEFKYYDPYNKDKNYTYYNKSYQKLEYGYTFNYKANFNNETYNKARTINYIFNNSKIGYIKDKDYYYISATKPEILENTEIESLVVNVKFNNVQVLEHNANNVSGNTYTWKLNKDSDINIKYRLKNSSVKPSDPDSNPSNPNPDAEEKEENSIFDYILVIAVVLLFIIAVIGLIKYKSINEYK